jgi:farnesyl-diphosphate farnesyltransferase
VVDKTLLQGVSRSFYLSLRFLPKAMREAAGLGYLLARTSDTLADSLALAGKQRLECLDEFARAVAAGDVVPRWSMQVLNAVADPRERRLLEAVSDCLAGLRALPSAEAALVREVVATIIGGQRLDLQRFASAEAFVPVALKDEVELEDYAWRVAGCVGEFWTKLGHLTMGDQFSNSDESEMIRLGVGYGKGLQLINILRDLPADLAQGRCYLPMANPADREALMACHRRWIERADLWIDDGFRYASMLATRRLKVASVMPAMIAKETLGLMKNASWDTLRLEVKVPRIRVYGMLIKAFCSLGVRAKD